MSIEGLFENKVNWRKIEIVGKKRKQMKKILFLDRTKQEKASKTKKKKECFSINNYKINRKIDDMKGKRKLRVEQKENLEEQILHLHECLLERIKEKKY